MRSGMLNKVIELWKKSVTKGDYGEITEAWAFNRNIRAYVHKTSGSQTIENDEVFDFIRLDVSIRNQTNIAEVDRLKINGSMYLIEFIQPDDTDRWLLIRCARINE
jgi:SPP1 family predicted phage head-tail adaptor